VKFSYIRLKSETPEGILYASARPVIPIKVWHEQKSVRYEALVDSGADISMFHAELAEVLGINLKQGKEISLYGIGHGQSKGYVHDIEIEIGGWRVPCFAAFCSDLIRPDPLNPGRKQGLHYGILGQDGFFDKFVVKFDRKVEQLEITPKSS